MAELDVSTARQRACRTIVVATVDGLTADDRLAVHPAIPPKPWPPLVDAGKADAAFLLAPTPVSSVMAVAAAGEFMPPKSTYFYPKAATGLVFDPLF